MTTIVISIVITINIVIGFITTIVGSRYRNKAIELIATHVIGQRVSMYDMQLTKPMLNELQKLVQQKFPQIIMTIETLSKGRINTTLITKEMATSSYLETKPSDVDELLKAKFGDYLFWSEYLTSMSFIAILLGLISLLGFIAVKSELDVLAILSIPVATSLLIAAGPLINNIRKKRNVKIKKEVYRPKE
jgi:hypothetical protein